MRLRKLAGQHAVWVASAKHPEFPVVEPQKVAVVGIHNVACGVDSWAFVVDGDCYDRYNRKQPDRLVDNIRLRSSQSVGGPT